MGRLYPPFTYLPPIQDPPIKQRELTCSKCQQPMAWHSDQEVHTRHGYALMQVFKCEACHRLKASFPTEADACGALAHVG
jgi:RNase P subunit RPR2